jgi:hypothetical protein|tara:strand:- start:23060 stop:23323 length:264 start_codon:yes stop_codon:yes gene_type:complete
MFSKKYIFVLAVAGLLFSCQKEIIRPNVNHTCVSADSDKGSGTIAGKSATGGNSTTGNSGSTFGTMKNVSDITDPNNDDDRNKKKKN